MGLFKKLMLLNRESRSDTMKVIPFIVFFNSILDYHEEIDALEVNVRRDGNYHLRGLFPTR